jgi:formylmethanofuran dehydrogenase subunit E
MKSYDEVADFHGHSCPGLALGYRVSLRALKELGNPSADEEVVAIVENDSCAVDAVQVMTGCTFGKGNLIFRDYGKQVYTFIKRATGKTVRISVDWKKPEETPREKAQWKRYMKGERSASVVRFVHDRKSSKIGHILEAGDRQLMKVTRGSSEPPPEASVYESVICESCGEKMMEPRARRKGGKTVCIPCFEGKKIWKK